MYIPIKPILEQFKIVPKGVIQVGAHWAEEHEHYLECGIKELVYIEPCKQAFGIMVDRLLDNRKYAFCGSPDGIVGKLIKNGVVVSIINCACGAEEKEVSMYVSHQNQGQSNSILKSNLHSIQHPEVIFDDTEIVKMVTLDSLPIKKEDYNILVTDCEGYDGEVMKGAKETLKYIDLVYSEINRGMTRDGNMLIDEFEELLWQEGFIKIKEFWPSPNLTWGDAVFVRRNFVTSEDLDML